jgi:hypothetical protein
LRVPFARSRKDPGFRKKPSIFSPGEHRITIAARIAGHKHAELRCEKDQRRR